MESLQIFTLTQTEIGVEQEVDQLDMEHQGSQLIIMGSFTMENSNNVDMKDNIFLLNFIRSNRFILYVAIFTVLFLSPNTYFVYYSLSIFSSPYREIASGGVAA